MAIILIIIILKTSLQVIRGSSWRREPLKSISESYCFQWKIKPTQDCCEGAARLVCEMWSYLAARCDTSLLFFSFSLHRRAVCLPVAFHPTDVMAEERDQSPEQDCVPERCTCVDFFCLLLSTKALFYIPDTDLSIFTLIIIQNSLYSPAENSTISFVFTTCCKFLVSSFLVLLRR